MSELTTEQRLDRMEQQLGLFESAFNAQEQLLANMMLGYSEMASTLEHIIATVTAPLDPKAKQEFLAEMRARHRETLAMLADAGEQVERGAQVNPDSPLAGHVPSEPT